MCTDRIPEPTADKDPCPIPTAVAMRARRAAVDAAGEPHIPLLVGYTADSLLPESTLTALVAAQAVLQRVLWPCQVVAMSECSVLPDTFGLYLLATEGKPRTRDSLERFAIGALANAAAHQRRENEP